jgi:hypothetical protein
VTVGVPPEGLALQASTGASASVKVRRFGDAFSAPLGSIPPGSVVTLTPAKDASSTPWRAVVATIGKPVRVCPRPA